MVVITVLLLSAMAAELHVCLVQYFARLEKLDQRWKELSKNAEMPLTALANQAEQFRNVINWSMEDVEEIMDKEMLGRLIFIIHVRLEEEVKLLSDILTQFNNAKQDLKNYLDNLENARSKVFLKDEAMRELIDGTPHRPKLDTLLIWAVDSFQFYHKIYLNIKNSMKLIDYKAEDTIGNVISSFKEDKRGRNNVNRILAFTQFLAKETVQKQKSNNRRSLQGSTNDKSCK